jgi:hypothetical protein
MCGQRALPPHPSVRELVGDAIAEFSGWDGKFADTIRTLVRKPGELTRQWLQGKRVHFISPLRLYLTASLLFFVLQASAPATTNPVAGPVVVDTRTAPGRASAAATKAMTGEGQMTEEQKKSGLAAAQKAPKILRPMMVRMIEDPAGLKKSLRDMIPRMFFALLPLYAGILALFYWRRKYPEHLYFAIHLHAFVFLALMFIEIAKYGGSLVSAIVSPFILAWIAIYSLAALRRVYGGGWGTTILKGIGIMSLYSVAGVTAMLVTFYLAAVL